MQPTVGIDFFAKEFLYKNQKTRLQLWDTAGQERFRSLIPSYLKNSHCAILVLDLSNKHSFENIESWLSMYRENTVGIPIAILAGNKADKVEERYGGLYAGSTNLRRWTIWPSTWG